MKNKVVLLRKQNKITQQELADAVGLSRQSIYAIEKGKFFPTVDSAIKIAEFFGTSVEDVFTLNDNWLVTPYVSDGTEKPIFGQGLDDYSDIKYGKYSFSFNGGELAAVYNAMLLSGKNTGLRETVEEFENNNMTVLNGLGGTDPKRLFEYFDGHDVEYERFTEKTQFLASLSDGCVFIYSYYSNFKRLIHTVSGKLTGDTVSIYNLENTDAAERIYNKDDFFSGRSFICGYIVNK